MFFHMIWISRYVRVYSLVSSVVQTCHFLQAGLYRGFFCFAMTYGFHFVYTKLMDPQKLLCGPGGSPFTFYTLFRMDQRFMNKTYSVSLLIMYE